MKDQETRAAGRTRPGNEKGMALAFALMGIMVLSMLAASLLYVSNTEAYASLHYKKEVQAVYASTTGVNSALD